MGAAFSYRERWAGNKLAEKCAGRFAPRRVSGDRDRQSWQDARPRTMAMPMSAKLFFTFPIRQMRGRKYVKASRSVDGLTSLL